VNERNESEMKDLIDEIQNKQALVGILFERGTDIDKILGDVAKQLTDRGLAVSGLLQVRGTGASDCDCRSMCLQDLSTGFMHPISENRGPRAVGCHLDRQALMTVAQDMELNLNGKTDILIINRFGQAEAEGRGFRGAIEKALMLGVQVLIAYRDEYQKEWLEFEGGMAISADPVADDIIAQLASGQG